MARTTTKERKVKLSPGQPTMLKANGKLSPKQTRVLKALEAGKTPDRIARQMKISVNGIYGHMRRIEEHGVDLSKYRRSPNGSSGKRARRSRGPNSRSNGRNPNGYSPGVQNFLKTLAAEESALQKEDTALTRTIEKARQDLADAEGRIQHVHGALVGIKAAREKV